ncbi:AAA family ATPase [Lysinibacillus sp. BW-2-10]|uniref:AAA family ATPase n=1 Tax=Lysinibacillus sp. BW-2-10 TaxID=2590030 RepID=UPI001643610F|nr:AAA family ATPase [Lysinibacillus sp. BW-2-10]
MKYIYIKDYKRFKNFELEVVPANGFNNEYRDYYGNMNVSTFVGENGVGKTTLLSFVVQIFHYLERYQDKIESEFRIKYEIQKDELKQEVEIRKEERNIYIKIPENNQELLLLEWKHLKGGHGVSKRKQFQMEIDNPDITYDEIKSYLPFNIITSVFSLHREYVSQWRENYYGDKLVKDYDITSVYGADHFKGSSISRGIARFINLYLTQNKVMVNLLNNLDLKFAPFVKVYFDRNIYTNNKTFERLNLESGWIELDIIDKSYPSDKLLNELVEAEFNEDIYINDIAFYKGEYVIDLETMSSGEKMFFYRIFSILSEIEDNSLVIIEEPELHLNPSWTKQIITMFYLLFNTYNAHFMVATHSYSFINTLFPENILLFKQGNVAHPTFNTFLSNEKEITSKLFRSSRNLNYTEETLLNKVKSTSSSKELKYIMDYLGDSFYKFMVFNELNDSED